MADASKVVKTGFLKAIGLFFEYDTPKIVHIESKKVGIINRIIQLIIIGYIIGYVIVWEKGYQEVDNVESSATTKLKGIALTNYTALNITPPSGQQQIQIWDVADYVVPPQESDAFFIMTNVIFTPNQTQGTCPEDPNMVDGLCDDDKDCPAGVAIRNGNGVRTGKCVQSAVNVSVKTCEILAWCPVEIDQLPLQNRSLLEDAQRFTVLIKNNIKFSKFNVYSRNILDTQNSTYLASCHYNKRDAIDQLCPIFELGTIISEAGVSNFNDIAVYGGVIAINIHWDCNLDFDISNCLPQYSFSRLDAADAKIAKGWNFRFADYYDVDRTRHRDLTKAYGIRFVIKVSGQAGKFSFIPLLLNIGSGIGLLALATVFCDIIVMYLLKNGWFYRKKKYMYVIDNDAFRPLQNDDESQRESRESQIDVDED